MSMPYNACVTNLCMHAYLCVFIITVYGDEGWVARPARFDKQDMYDDYNEFTRTAAAEYNVSPSLHLYIYVACIC